MTRFHGKVALVTGGAGAIGAAAAVRLAGEGAAVAVVDRDEARAEATAARLTAIGAEALAVAADVGEPAEVDRAVDATRARFGRLDVVFNNAGVPGERAPIHELDISDFDDVLRINLRGIFLVLRASVRAIAEGGGGAIVNMGSSMAGWDVLSGGAAYAASKQGVLGLTRSAALDAAPYGIRINAVCPGVIETPLGIPDLEQGTSGRDRFAARIPLRRVGTPDDVAAVVAFLASDDARHVTGAALLVDGGQTLQSWSNAPAADSFPLAGGDPTHHHEQRRDR
jgi:NAD(P)-dependent dehydrogenase (short-subunit alcohol dehydrogenase family)